MIPGFPIGSEVSYYFALQDSMNRMMATLPSGGRGISPPGTQAPHSLFAYAVEHTLLLNECSPNTPLAINDMQNTYDQIEVNVNGNVIDLNVKVDISHTRTGELKLILRGPDATSVMLSDRNGGDGDNYTNTVFDDQADQSINTGIPPFNGRFRPEFPLSTFNGKPAAGSWQLRINDGGLGNSGTLNSWCLQLLYPDPSTGTERAGIVKPMQLEQNFPNPASGSTSIYVDLPVSSFIKLTLLDLYGRQVDEIATGQYEAGRHLFVTSLGHLKPGTYLYRLENESVTEIRSLVIIR